MNVTRVSDEHFVVSPPAGTELKYLLLKVEGANGRSIRIDLEGPQFKGWGGVNPLYSYSSDLTDPSAFESRQPASGETERANNGPLLDDTSGQRWHFVQDVWREGGRTCFRQRFDADVVYITHRIPYLPAYNERFLTTLTARPDMEVVTVGKSKQGRALQLVRVGTPSPRRPCILIYAREHGNEPDPSYVAQGALDFVSGNSAEAKELQAKFTFVVIPLLDPDGATQAIYENITTTFANGVESPESIAYSAWFKKWVDAGNRLDLILNLHNPSPSHPWHLTCWEWEVPRVEHCRSLHSLVMREMGKRNLLTEPTPFRNGLENSRLAWWLVTCFGSLVMHYEINSQNPTRHLNLSALRNVGTTLVLASCDYLGSEDGQSLLRQIDQVRSARAAALARRQAPQRAGTPIAEEIALHGLKNDP